MNTPGTAPNPISTNDIENRFAYHPPQTSDVAAKHQAIRDALRTTAHFVVGQIPPGREASLAITALEEAMMWANAAIARHGNTPAGPDQSEARPDA